MNRVLKKGVSGKNEGEGKNGAGGYSYGFNGMERDDEVKGTGNHYSAMFWEMDPRIVKRWNPDPIVKPHESPYAILANNPIWFVDPNGSDTLVFDVNNKYSHTIKAEGTDVGLKLGKEGFVFEFADPENDPVAIESGEIDELKIFEPSAILTDLERAGVFEEENQGFLDGPLFLFNESDAGSERGNGKVDFAFTSELHKSEDNKDGLRSHYLYITKSKDVITGHNARNFGNFLWGASANTVGVNLNFALEGADWNNFFSGAENDNKWYWERKFDSEDDKYSISLGYRWMFNQTRKK